MTQPSSSCSACLREQATLFRTAARLVSGAGRNASLLVLTYHRVPAQPDPLAPDEPDAATFGAHMDVIRDTFNVLTLGEAVALRAAARLPARAVCITFDDGYANNAEVALPILKARGLSATFFVATGFLDGGRMWNDSVIEAVRRAPQQLDLTDLGLEAYALPDDAARRAAIDRILNLLKYRELADRERASQAIAARVAERAPVDLMMTSRQVAELAAAGMEIGAHTVSHPILTRTDSAIAMREIVASRTRLQDITGQPVASFAYPNGRPGRDYAREHVEMVRNAGFHCAVSTAWGCVTPRADAYQLARIAPWGATARRYVLRTVRAYTERRPAVV